VKKRLPRLELYYESPSRGLKIEKTKNMKDTQKVKQIMDAPVATMFKAAVLEARRGWISTSNGSIRTGYREVGRRLAHYVLNQDHDGAIASELEGKDRKGIIEWLRRARSRYMALVPRKHQAQLADGFIEGLEEEEL
jgi:hypothetical protein